jgi:hypothetical protein
MATQAQFSYFKSIYDEENARQTSLQDRAKYYLSLITFYSAFILFVAQNAKPDTLILKVLFVLIIVLMLVAFLLSLLSIRVSKYEVASDPAEIIHDFGEAPQDDSDFFDRRIADFTVAYERNSKVNDGKALMLAFAGYMLLAGILLHAVFILLKVT